MGKVLSVYTNGWPGAVARALDDVVVSQPNRSGAELAFGVPVALSAAGDGVVPFDPASHTGADFVGITVRAPAKTPDAYGSDVSAYAAGDLTDVLVRGHIAAETAAGAYKPGDPVSVEKSTGKFAVGTGNDYVALPNVRISGLPDAGGVAELLLTERAIL